LGSWSTKCDLGWLIPQSSFGLDPGAPVGGRRKPLPWGRGELLTCASVFGDMEVEP